MLAIIALVLIAIVALAVLGFAVHVLFSPWLLLAARREGGSPSLSLMACWTCSLPGRESTVMTYSLRRKMSSTGLVFAWYSRSRTASASSVSSSRLISSPPQASHFPSVDGLLSIRL